MNAETVNFGLKSEVVAKISNVFLHYPQIEQAIVFGSRAKGNHHAGSDIDLSLKGELLTYAQLMRIENELDDLLLPYKIDLLQFDTIDSQDLARHIERVGRVFYQKPEEVE